MSVVTSVGGGYVSVYWALMWFLSTLCPANMQTSCLDSAQSSKQYVVSCDKQSYQHALPHSRNVYFARVAASVE